MNTALRVLFVGCSVCVSTACLSAGAVESSETAMEYQGVISSRSNETYLVQIVTNWTRTAEFEVEGTTAAFQPHTEKPLWRTCKVLGPINELSLSPDGRYAVWVKRWVTAPKDASELATNTPVVRVFREGVLLKELTVGDLAVSTRSVGTHSRQVLIHGFSWGSPLLRDDHSPNMGFVQRQMDTSIGRAAEPTFKKTRVRFVLLDGGEREIEMESGTVSIQWTAVDDSAGAERPKNKGGKM